MRKQYHFRPSASGFRAWDVDRLVTLTRDFPRLQVPLDAIRELDEPYWFSGGAHDATCRAVLEHARFIEEANLTFPIILSSDGRVMDGMHRVAKAVLSGLKSIEAVRFERDPEPDFVDVYPSELTYEETWYHTSSNTG
ncbi:MAG: hypothetical protein H0X34_19885 [Chthoniobacterales bacterium]|nr:hypothetical protein [Chthoniobacterales bacterium]